MRELFINVLTINDHKFKKMCTKEERKVIVSADFDTGF